MRCGRASLGDLAAPATTGLWPKSATFYDAPLLDLVFRAAGVHRQFHDPAEVQVCKLISIKTGGCPEDCSYCSQSSRYQTEVKASPLMEKEEVLDIARRPRRPA